MHFLVVYLISTDSHNDCLSLILVCNLPFSSRASKFLFLYSITSFIHDLSIKPITECGLRKIEIIHQQQQQNKTKLPKKFKNVISLFNPNFNITKKK